MIQKLELLPLLIVVFVVSLVLHELAHAIVGTKLGDTTPRAHGRLTLNPLKHLDPVGSAVFLVTYLLFGLPFGWAKPVQINTRYLKHPQRDMALVAVAGPLVNLALAIVFGVFLAHRYGADSLMSLVQLGGSIDLGLGFLDRFVLLSLTINLVLFVFNLLPVPPLDGSRIIAAFMPRELYRQWSELDQYGFIFLGILLLGFGPQFSETLVALRNHTLQYVIIPIAGG
ncbi:MAG: site-2 protease family protein [Thermoleophilia bacterium]|nr:site-2 protease family protein [Thermoleophilia bacterium]